MQEGTFTRGGVSPRGQDERLEEQVFGRPLR